MHLADPIRSSNTFHFHPVSHPIVAHSGWTRARGALLDALRHGESVALLGPSGCGKTLLLRDLLRTLRGNGSRVRMVERGDVLEPRSWPDILLIDEAGRIRPEMLSWLCTAQMRFILAALPDFAGRLTEICCPARTVVMQPLSPEEVARFLAAKLARAGRPRDLLEPRAVLALARLSGGLIRTVNGIAEGAVFLSELEGSQEVCERHVVEAATMRGFTHEEAPPEAQAGSDQDTVAVHDRAGQDTTLAIVPGPDQDAAGRVTHPIDITRSGNRRLGSGPEDRARSALKFRPLQARSRPNGRGRKLPAAHGLLTVGLGIAIIAFLSTSRVPSSSPARENHPARPILAEPAAQADRSGPATGARAPGADEDAKAADSPARDPGPAQAEIPSPELEPLIRAPSPTAAQASDAEGPLLFAGRVYNVTLGQGGLMSLAIRKLEPPGSVTVRFEAWAGLLGSGELTGRLSDDGHLSAWGRLLVGRNPFLCELRGRLIGNSVTGSADFVREEGGRVTHSEFGLIIKYDNPPREQSGSTQKLRQ